MEEETKSTRYMELLEVLNGLGATIDKSAVNPHFKSGYVPLPELLPIVKPALAARNFLLVQPLFDTGRPNTVGVRTIVIDATNGQIMLDSQFAIPCDGTNPQKATSSVTYGRRTGITSLVGIAEKDDDGNTASKPAAQPSAGATAPAAGGSQGGWF